MESEIEKSELELKSLTEQVEGLRRGLKGISEEDRDQGRPQPAPGAVRSADGVIPIVLVHSYIVKKIY